MNDSAKWNTKYIANSSGKVYKIKELNLTQVNSYIAFQKSNIRTSRIMLEKLYEKRSILLGEPVDENKAQRKILQALQYKSVSNEDADRLRSIILLALDHLNKDSSYDLIKAILEQARDNE